ncbi:thioredoxin-like isoform X1 [Branchiostoma floridae x Branchiostoma belcheri]
MVHEIQDVAEFETVVIENQSLLLLVYFTATWCGPCKMLGPEYERASTLPEYKDVKFVMVDVDEAEDVSAYCKITVMPMIHFYKDGKKVDEMSGANRDRMIELLHKHMK